MLSREEFKRANLVNFSRDRFNGFLGAEPFDKSKAFRTLPGNEEVTVDMNSLHEHASKMQIPYSQLAAHIQGITYIRDILPKHTLRFLSVQGNDTADDLEYALLQEGLDGKPKEYGPGQGPQLVQDIMRRDFQNSYGNILITAGLYRYVMPLLKKFLTPNEKYGYPLELVRYQTGDWEYYSFRYLLTLDLAFLARYYSRKDSLFSLAYKNGCPGLRLVSEADLTAEESRKQMLSILTHLWEKLPLKELYAVMQDITSTDPNVLQASASDRFKQLVLYNTMLSGGYLPVAEPKHYSPEKHKTPLIRHVEGLYTDMVEYDINRAYPTTMINLDLGLYNGDRTLAELEKSLLKIGDSDSRLDRFLKQLSVELNGFLRYQPNIMRNENAYDLVVGSVSSEMLNLAQKLTTKYGKRPARIHTDSILVSSSVKPADVAIDGYTFKKEVSYSWVYVYNANHTVGLTDEGKIVRTGPRPVENEKLRELTEQHIDHRLTELTAADAIDSLNSCQQYVKPLIAELPRLGPEYFMLFYSKQKKDSFTAPRHLAVIDQLRKGRNIVYMGKKGVLLHEFDPDKLDFKYYADQIRRYADVHSTEVKHEAN